MGSSYLIDSNIIIYFLEGKIPDRRIELVRQIFDSQPQFSVITQIEILGFKNSMAATTLLKHLTEAALIFSLSPEIVEKTIKIRKSVRIRLPDAIIAATAVHHDLILITRNTNDFKNITQLQLENPFS